MTSHLMAGFADELVKTAGKTSILTKALSLAKKTKDPEYRKRILSAAGLGAATDVASGAVSGSDDSALKRAIRGAAGGAVTGAAFPGWFAKSNRNL